MRNQVKMWEGSLTGDEFPPTVGWWLVCAIGGFVGLFGTPHLWAFIVLFTFLFMAAVNTIGYFNHLARVMSKSEINLWNGYKSLDSTTRSNINFKREHIGKLDSTEINILKKMIQDQSEHVYESSDFKLARNRLRDEYEVQKKMKELV